MPLFSRNRTAPPTELRLSDFVAKAKADDNYAAYLAKFGARTTTLNLQALFDRNLRMMTPAGLWGPSVPPDYNRVAVGNTLLKVSPGDQANFDLFLSEQLRQDVTKTTARERYIADLKVDAAAGRLLTRLQADTELETARGPAVAAPGAPPIPPTSPRMINESKAIGWATGYPGGIGEHRSTCRRAFQAHTTRNARFPIHSVPILNAIWRQLVSGAPVYRAVNIMLPTKYPSSLAGAFITKNVIADFTTTPQPIQGDDLWYDWALYFFAAIMTSQGFTDGNKRVSRLAYALILIDGGVDFLAPNARLGAQLGDM